MPRPRSKIRRDQQLNFSLTQEELTGLHRRADEAGLHIIDYGRRLLLHPRSAAGRQDPAAADAQHTLARAAQLLAHELRRLGNNLNQITRRLHSLKEPAPPTLEPLLREIRSLLNRGVRP